MAQASQNIRRKQGDTYKIEATILDSDGSAYDLSNVQTMVLGIDLRSSVPESDSATIELSGSVVSAVDGTMEFDVSAEAAALTPSSYNAEIQMTETGGIIITTDTFKYTVLGQIVR